VRYVLLSLLLINACMVYAQSNFVEVSAGNPIFSIQGGRGVCIADYDNDGDDDLYIASNPNKLFRNEGNFIFTDVTTISGLGGSGQVAVWFDADDDGWLDIYIGSWTFTKFFKNNGNGTFTELTTTGLNSETAPQALLVGDLDGDKLLDVYSNNFQHQNQLFINKSGFQFEDRVSISGAFGSNLGMGGILTDVDNDKDLDIYLVYDGNYPNKLYQNNGHAIFQEVAPQMGLNFKGQGMGVDVADFNHDGTIDFYITNLFDNALLLSQPSGVYLDKAKEKTVNDFGMTWGVVCLDYNNDTYSDVYINNVYGFSPYTNKLYRNNAGTDFTEVSVGTSLENKSGGYGCAASDFNSDGKPDIVVVNYSTGGVKVFKNEEPVVGNWIEINLVGTATNKFGIGARVEINTTEGAQFKEVISGSGYSSQNSSRIHFGLASATVIGQAKIFWPDGSVNGYDNVAVNTRYLAIQNESLTVFNTNEYRLAVSRPSQLLVPPDTIDIDIPLDEGLSTARIWNEAQLKVIRKDFARPTVQARNLFHISMAMYDAWAAFDEKALTFFLGKTVGNFNCPFNGITTIVAKPIARNEAISYAAFRLIMNRYSSSPGAAITIPEVKKLFATLGYDESFTSTDYSGGSPAALGNYIASKIIEFGLGDGSNEALGFQNQYYQPFNQPMLPVEPGVAILNDPNRWQPVTLSKFIDQNGNEISNTPPFLTPEWGNVVPFAMKPSDRQDLVRDGNNYKVYHDPGAPPQLDKVNGTGQSNEYKWNFELVSAWSSHLDPADSVKIDISPATIGNIQTYPTTLAEYHNFYDFENGGDKVTGHSVNPKTSLPYQPQIVYRGDYTRVLAEFWADGPNSETPPGHWFTILNYVNDHPDFERKFAGTGEKMEALEWDVKSYFTLSGALHDVAITAWGIKGYYDYVRPVSAIRYLSVLGQSTDNTKPHYHPAGIELKPGLIELVEIGDPLAGANNEHIGKIKLHCWKGPSYITVPATDKAGVGWILGENWFPYQRPTFVTPPFAGYISGHSTYSSAAAEVLTLLTGDEFFPGGIGEFHAPKNEYLVFEDGPSQDITLQWARYKDASDQCSLSRIWGGIHPPADDIPGRHIGKVIGHEAFDLAVEYFTGAVTSVETVGETALEIYPNPAARNQSLRIKSPENLFGSTISIFDILGREILNEAIQDSGYEINFNLGDAREGLHIIQVKCGGKLISKRLLIK
jgi:ASPIC and UnbV/FG-GAP-like repeat/Secretion system C-terminal sorting domain